MFKNASFLCFTDKNVPYVDENTRLFLNFVVNFNQTMLRLIRLILCLFVVSLTSLSIMAGDFIVVLDPGHGGHDYGAIGAKAREKDINLGVALKLGALLKKEKGVKVVYTRDGDYFKTLQQRADIANKAHGDLFISIHTNSLDKKARNRKTISGASTYTLGLHKSAENLAVAKRENAVMMLEDDFSTTYCGFDPNSTESYIIFELSQNNHLDQSIDFAGKLQSEMKSTAGRVDRGVRQAGFWVLAKTSMPAVLIELDFICNPTVERYLASESGQKKFAEAIHNAFKSYKTAYDHRQGVEPEPDVDVDDDQQSVDDDSDKKKRKEMSERKKRARNRPESIEGNKSSAKEVVIDDGDVASESSEEGLRYKIQFLTSGKPLSKKSKEFKGLKNVDSYRDGGLHKYTVGNYKSMDDAEKELRKVRAKFPEAFVITMRDGKRIK